MLRGYRVNKNFKNAHDLAHYLAVTRLMSEGDITATVEKINNKLNLKFVSEPFVDKTIKIKKRKNKITIMIKSCNNFGNWCKSLGCVCTVFTETECLKKAIIQQILDA